MLGVSSSKDGDNGIELSLELSIGGCYKEIEKPLMETESEKLSDVSDALDQQRKREFHALRRQEARRKKAEKQKRSISLSKEKGYFEAQMFQTRVEDREKRENENTEEFARKNNVNGGFGNSSGVAFLGNNQSVGKQRNDEKNSKNLFQPISSKILTPCQNGYGNTSGDLSQITFVGVDSECKNSGKCEPGNQKVVSKVSNGSLERSSSAFSDYQSNSQKGGSCSTDTGSHSNYSQGYQQQQLRASATSAIFEQAKQEINASSSHINSNQPKNKTSDVDIKLPTPAHELQPPNPPEQTSSSSKGSSEVAVVSTAKPPKPQTNNQMPFVSTTGNGPNGKKVNGFLYRYNKAEVCIVCVCHGSSFSPAEFVEHAGGVNISHPLKHITIVPAAFG